MRQLWGIDCLTKRAFLCSTLCRWWLCCDTEQSTIHWTRWRSRTHRWRHNSSCRRSGRSEPDHYCRWVQSMVRTCYVNRLLHYLNSFWVLTAKRTVMSVYRHCRTLYYCLMLHDATYGIIPTLMRSSLWDNECACAEPYTCTSFTCSI